MLAPRNLEEEKQLIKRALGMPMQENAIWQPIATEWMQRWKTYVNFDETGPDLRSKDMIESLFPGEVDNNSLQGSFGDEMRRSAVEGRDYMMLPTASAAMLFEKYKGGPQFPRKVLNVGTQYTPIMQVNLFPVRIEVYHCDKYQVEPVQMESRFRRRYFNKNLLLHFVADDLRGMFQISDIASTVRYWIKQTPASVSTNKQRQGRLLTSDVVEFDGEWRFVRAEKSRPIQEVLGDNDCISLIIESVAMRNPRDAEWPRYQQLEKWKDSLQVGDFVDAKDRKLKYYDAVIKDIDELGNLTVHFIGWSEESDEKIPVSEIHSRIQPLHSNTYDRSKWEENDRVDVRIAVPDGKFVWITGTVIEIDPLNDRVQVLVDAKEKSEALAKKSSSSNGAGMGTAFQSVDVRGDLDMDGDDFDADDDNKKGKSSSSSSKATATIMDEAEEEEKQPDNPTSTSVAAAVDSLREWYEIYSDNICPINTHTTPLRPVYSTAVTSYSGIGNYYSSPSNYGTGYGLTSMYGGGSNYSYDRNTKGTPPVAGAVGLQNLGNTCFMNSILQCLSNTQILTEMFTQGTYKEQINYDNPLGHNGKIAMTYGKLIKEIWSGAYTKVVPREFKSVIGEFRPQFAGYDQQDSQELMSCCLDGLHEDLNRIVRKPYTKKIESKSRPDDLIASESWRRFLQRNDSLIVERFFGQQKSHVTCRNCGKESVTFDEFLSLSLPIPVRNTRIINVVVQLLPLGSTPRRVQLEVELTAPMAQLKRILIDKLVECGVLELPVVAASPVNGAQQLPASVNDSVVTVVDSDFELVSREDITSPTTDDYQMIVDDADKNHANGEVSVSKVAKKANGGKAAPVSSPYDRLHFHFGMIYGTRPSTIFKNYNAAEARNTAISAFVNKMDTLVAFQLEYALPDFKGISSYNLYGTSNRPTETKVEEPTCFGMDLSLANKVDHRYELMGFPYRLSFPKEATTNADVHVVARQILASLLADSSPLLDQDPRTWPYDLYVTSAYAAVTNRKVEDNDVPFLELKEGQEVLCAVWRTEAIRRQDVVPDKSKVVIDLDADKEGGGDDADDDDNDGYNDIYSSRHRTGGTTKKGKRLSIYDCLDKYVEKEQLADTETLYCNRCKEMLAPIKKMDIWTSPDVLILHLKRFQFVAGQYMVLRDKINDVVDFPIEGLDLTRYVRGPQFPEALPMYDLFAVSHHMGGLGGGHYTATCRNFLDNNWYNFNDSHVSSTEASSAVSSTAYVLFYRRRAGSLKWAGMVPHPVGLPDEEDD